MPTHVVFAAATGFEAAREVTVLPSGHRSRRLHGHSFLARVRAELPAGWADFPGAEVDTLTAQLKDCVAPLDYHLLNEVMPQPTDENLSRWVHSRLAVPELSQVGIQSTADAGVELDRRNHAHIWRRYRFEAAHRLPNVPAGHKCGRMHGHGFEVILHADQDVAARDLGVDYDFLDECWAPIQDRFHQACLNDIPGLENPTSELIASWVWHHLKPRVPELSWVTCFETSTSGAHFDGNQYRIWKELTFDSAVRLRGAPAGDARQRIHGHTFTLRLHLSAPLDAFMGWTIDFGDVKQLFEPIYRLVDHHPLYDLPDSGDGSTAALARWIQDRAAPVLPALDRIDLYETRGAGVILSWGQSGPALPI